jgi:hypothetical protein
LDKRFIEAVVVATNKDAARSLPSKPRVAMEKKTGRLFDIYWCPWCRKWHIGGSVKEKRN